MNLKVFINSMFVSNFVLSSNSNVNVKSLMLTIGLNSDVNYVFGSGFMYKRLSCELRYLYK